MTRKSNSAQWEVIQLVLYQAPSRPTPPKHNWSEKKMEILCSPSQMSYHFTKVYNLNHKHTKYILGQMDWQERYEITGWWYSTESRIRCGNKAGSWVLIFCSRIHCSWRWWCSVFLSGYWKFCWQSGNLILISNIITKLSKWKQKIVALLKNRLGSCFWLNHPRK